MGILKWPITSSIFEIFQFGFLHRIHEVFLYINPLKSQIRPPSPLDPSSHGPAHLNSLAVGGNESNTRSEAAVRIDEPFVPLSRCQFMAMILRKMRRKFQHVPLSGATVVKLISPNTKYNKGRHKQKISFRHFLLVYCFCG